MNANIEYLRRLGYHESGRLFVGARLTGISYVDPQPDHEGNHSRFAFLPFDTLALEVGFGCPADLMAEIEVDAARIIARGYAAQ